jgi:hypothetical protein
MKTSECVGKVCPADVDEDEEESQHGIILLLVQIL